MNLETLRRKLKAFDFRGLFNELGWEKPTLAPFTLNLEGKHYQASQQATLAGIGVWNVSPIPPKDQFILAYQQIQSRHSENITIFSQGQESVWYWAKQEKGKLYPRISYYSKEQTGDAILAKLQYLGVDFDELDQQGNLSLTTASEKLQKALDIAGVTKVFYAKFQDSRLIFTESIQGIANEKDKAYYASVILNRLMFIYFLQKKNFLPSPDYLSEKLKQYKGYYKNFLIELFFEGFAKEEAERSNEVKAKVGKIKYLNGSIFTPHPLEIKYPNIDIPDLAFEKLFALFNSFQWALDDSPSGNDNEISPYVLGYIFERYINQKALGAYYTRPEITSYLCRNTIESYIAKKMKAESLEELLLTLGQEQAEELLEKVLPELSVLDPACGSGAFLVAALDSLYQIYAAIISKAQNSGWAAGFFEEAKKHKSISYFIKKRIISHNLFGVDIVPEASEIARLRLFLSLVASAKTVDELEPLPNIDFNIQAGNSLVGLMVVNEEDYKRAFPNRTMFDKEYPEILSERATLLEKYREAERDNLKLKAALEANRTEAMAALNRVLLQQMSTTLRIKFKQATWDGKDIKYTERPLTLKDIEDLTPFHWGFEFSGVMQRGGFSLILGNPPWQAWKPNSREFLLDFSPSISRIMDPKKFEKERTNLLKDSELKHAYLTYMSNFYHTGQYFAKHFNHQRALVDAKTTSSDINLYKLFVELTYDLLQPGGLCGLVIPDGIYNQLGTTGLRRLLFNNCQVQGLFCFENKEGIFEDVDSRFKFVVLTFSKGGTTKSFPVAFMRHEVRELENFPKEGALEISYELIQKASPEVLSVTEYKNPLETTLEDIFLTQPRSKDDKPWSVKLTREFDLANDKHLFHNHTPGFYPLYQGNMIHQFSHLGEKGKYYVDPLEGRKALLGRNKDQGQSLDYQRYRLAYRRIASSTNERTMIATILPKNVFLGHTLTYAAKPIAAIEMLWSCGLLNSFVFDYALRQRVSSELSMFIIDQMPLPKEHPLKNLVATLAAKLICTTPEFDELAKQAGLRGYQDGVSDTAERLAIRCQLDALCAKIYGLTEEQFAYILGTFPNVEQAHKDGALAQFRG